MLNLMLFLLFNQTIHKEQFLLIDKDSISFSKLINQLPKPKVALPVTINANQQECFT